MGARYCRSIPLGYGQSQVCFGGRGLRVCVVRSAQFFLKFVIEQIGIGFLIIKTDAYRLGSVFRPIAVQFFAVGLIDLVGFLCLFFLYFG